MVSAFINETLIADSGASVIGIQLRTYKCIGVALETGTAIKLDGKCLGLVIFSNARWRLETKLGRADLESDKIVRRRGDLYGDQFETREFRVWRGSEGAQRGP